MTIAELHERRDFAPVREVATTVGDIVTKRNY